MNGGNLLTIYIRPGVCYVSRHRDADGGRAFRMSMTYPAGTDAEWSLSLASVFPWEWGDTLVVREVRLYNQSNSGVGTVGSCVIAGYALGEQMMDGIYTSAVWAATSGHLPVIRECQKDATILWYWHGMGSASTDSFASALTAGIVYVSGIVYDGKGAH